MDGFYIILEAGEVRRLSDDSLLRGIAGVSEKAALRSASVAPRAGSALLGGSLRLTPLLAGRSETEA
ncbi:MAG: hypothetical protein O3A82_17325, partial [Verrucomicrobia bacterium]|nr:hypothetical protein [Verrucomicrobiota bacterium]